MDRIMYEGTRSQISVDKFSCLPLDIKISLSALWSDGANPASLLSISTCCTTSTHSWKRKAPSLSFDKFGSSSSSSYLLLPLFLCSAPPFAYSIWWWQSGHYAIFTLSATPPPLPHPTLLRCPPSFPVTPPLSLSYYELYYFDPGPSICFNWIMICNHVLSGESIKWAGASAPLLRGLLLFPHPPHTHTHLIQALLLSAFRPPLNTLAHGQPLQPAVGLVKGVEEGGGGGGGGGVWWLRCWFFMAPALQWEGAKRDKVEPSRREWGDTGGGEGRRRGCLEPGPAPTKSGPPPHTH